MKNALKKVGILNFHHSTHNYGAVLQAYALQEALAKLGYDSEHISLFNTKTRIKNYYIKIKNLIKIFLRIEFMIKGREQFQIFRDKYLRTSKDKFLSMKQLINRDFNYDSIIVGSDQVWRPRYLNKFIDAYFLSFVRKPIKKIAYAASFGVDYWEHTDDLDLTEKIKNHIKDFTAVSVREVSGVEICKKHFDTEALHVLDPTLLVGKDIFLDIIANPKKTCEGIVYCILDKSPDFTDFLKHLESALDIQSRDIYNKRISKYVREYLPVSEWLTQIKNSKFVITDSFHCICFSLLFNKEFIYYINEKRGLARIESLFQTLNIKDRIVDSLDEDYLNKILGNKLDYININKRLENLRKPSYEFLRETLQ